MECKFALVLLMLATVFEAVRCDFKLVLLHTNDMHSRFDETDARSAPCREKQCYGGFARLRTAVVRARQEAEDRGQHALFLNAGDTYQGSIYYTMYKWTIVADMINKMGIDVMSLGNHEFDDGPSGLEPFVRNSTTPIVCANADLSGEPSLQKSDKIVPSKVLEVAGVRIGIVGYLTPETRIVASLGAVQLLDEVEAVKKEVQRLKATGVNILIGLGHSGYDVDQKIAREVPDLDIVVGGHTNTFLYTGKAPDVDKPEGPYPTVVKGVGGRMVRVVQAYAYTKYLGKLEVTFDEGGEIKEAQGNPVLIDNAFSKDDEVESVLRDYKNRLSEDLKKRVGTSKVFLEADKKPCRVGECNFGNLITDAIVDANAKNYSGKGWTDAPIAFVLSGGLRASMDVVNKSSGNITIEDLRTTMPYDHYIEMLTVSGKTLLEVLENSVKRIDMDDKPGAFLQYSGVHVLYDLNQPTGHRVVSASARCGDCNVPRYFPIQHEQKYNVMTTDYQAGGGEDYTMLKEIKERKKLHLTDWRAVATYLNKSSPVWPEISGRIRFVEQPTQGSSSSLIIAFLGVTGIAIAATLLFLFYWRKNHVLRI